MQQVWSTVFLISELETWIGAAWKFLEEFPISVLRLYLLTDNVKTTD